MGKDLTERQNRFVKEVLKDPTNKTEAAIKAGYSPRVAPVMASRLMRHPAIRHVLQQHFVDAETEVADSLLMALSRLKALIQDSKPDTFLKASKLLLEYTRLASAILGLDLKFKTDAPQIDEALDVDSIISQHKAEIAKLELVKSRRVTTSPN